MPPKIHGASGTQHTDFSRIDHKYEYPDGLNLKPGSELHNKLRDMVLERVRESESVMVARHGDWKKIDHTLTAYISPDVDEKKVQLDDPRKPVSIVVPISYAVLDTLLTYWTATFFDRPIFRFEGIGPEDTYGAILLEKLVDLQCVRGKAELALHTMFRGGLGYGFGVVTPVWKTRRGTRTIKDPILQTDLFGNPTVIGNRLSVIKDQVLFEGNILENINHYNYRPDPNVAIQDVQKAEFVSWIAQDSYMSLLAAEHAGDEDYINVLYLKDIQGVSQHDRRADSGIRDRAGQPATTSQISVATKPIDVINMYITLIPSERGIGDSNYPEKWLLSLAGDEVIIRCVPMNLDHNMYPVAVCSPDYDGYTVTPISRLEVIYGLQHTMDWLFSSHVANVRKAIHDMLIVDPSLVNMADLSKPGPGIFARLRRSAWGRGVKDAVEQLSITDVTRTHIADSVYIADLIEKVSGAVDSLQGIMRKGGERRSAEESRNTRAGALSRLQKSARIAGVQAMQDIGFMMASHTQQLMTQDAYVKAIGRWEDTLRQEYGVEGDIVPVGRSDILVDFDIAVNDGSVPGTENVEGWLKIFEIAASQPQIGGSFDVVRIFEHVARELGAKNVQDFVMKGGNIRAKVMQDKLVEAEAAKGNLKPVANG